MAAVITSNDMVTMSITVSREIYSLMWVPNHWKSLYCHCFIFGRGDFFNL
jgi:hypothetical protein